MMTRGDIQAIKERAEAGSFLHVRADIDALLADNEALQARVKALTQTLSECQRDTTFRYDDEGNALYHRVSASVAGAE